MSQRARPAFVRVTTSRSSQNEVRAGIQAIAFTAAAVPLARGLWAVLGQSGRDRIGLAISAAAPEGEAKSTNDTI